MEVIHQGVDTGDDLVAASHLERAAGAEIILDVDDNKGFVRGAHAGLFPFQGKVVFLGVMTRVGEAGKPEYGPYRRSDGSNRVRDA